MLSRLAESFYWIGRYLERAEATARLLAEHYHLTVEDRSVNDDVAAAVVLGSPSIHYSGRAAVGDLNGDGRADLVSAMITISSYRIQWERNVSGPGIHFVPGGDVAPPTGPVLAAFSASQFSRSMRS